jgi:centromere/kinetochore protein ZW10
VLFNTLVAHMIDSTTALEDISSDAARKLHALMQSVDEKGASLFLREEEGAEARGKVKGELLRYVAQYGKFTELQLVLSGSLQEIADRWAEGAGPLASEFSPAEVKQLVRALFQNTDRRAAVLAKIK